MSTRDLMRSPGVRMSFVFFVGAAAVLALAVVQAVRVDPLPDPPAVATAQLQGDSRRSERASSNVQAAVDNDLFSPDRSAPAAPYRMPGEAAPSDKPAVEAPKPNLLGTAIATDGHSFATLQLGTDHPMLVHVGDKIGVWIVKSIQRGKVVLMSSGGTRADLSVPKPGT